MGKEEDNQSANVAHVPETTNNKSDSATHVNHDEILPASATSNGDTTVAQVTNGKDEKALEPQTAVEAEGQVKKYPYPKSIAFIISNEFCERFNYYGMRTILVLYLSRQLGFTDDFATVMFHIFTMLVYFLCVFGAIISDSWLGKFRTIFYLSLVYVAGSVMLTLGAIPPLNLPATVFTMIGLFLVALGSGGIKPCVSAFGGDQFKLPEQLKQMTTFFSIFYFAINSGSLISTTVTPILREDVRCFDGGECYSLAFGVPAVLMILSIVFFLLGKPLYKIKPPAGNMLVLVSKTVWAALTGKCKEKKTNPREHWLDYADTQFDRQLIDDTKVLMRVLWLFVPLPLFWALFDQQGSRWVFQATRMDGDMGSWNIKPDQMNLLNPLLILVFIPLYEVAFYPLLNLVGVRRPLQKLTLGGILAGVAFVLSGVVELKLEETYPLLPQPMNAQLRVFNGEPCAYVFTSNIPNLQSFEVPAVGYYEYKDVPMDQNGNFTWTFTVTPTSGSSENCYSFPARSEIMMQRTAHSLFLSSKGKDGPYYWYKDSIEKPDRSDPLIRTLANVEQSRTIKWEPVKKNGRTYTEPAYTHNLTSFDWGEYSLLIDDVKVAQPTFKYGGVYTFIVSESSAGVYLSKEVVLTTPNSVNVLWQIPQFVILTLGEVMFSVTGLEFSYSQAPLSMKSVLTACWLLTVAFGNVIVVIIAEADLFDSQASEFFLFAGLMFVDMMIFMVLAYFYKPNNPMESNLKDDTKQLIEPLAIEKEGFENKSMEKEKE